MKIKITLVFCMLTMLAFTAAAWAEEVIDFETRTIDVLADTVYQAATPFYPGVLIKTIDNTTGGDTGWPVVVRASEKGANDCATDIGIPDSEGTVPAFDSRWCGSSNTKRNYPVGSGFNSLSDTSEGLPPAADPKNRKQDGFLVSFDFPVSDFSVTFADWGDYFPPAQIPTGESYIQINAYDKDGIPLGSVESSRLNAPLSTRDAADINGIITLNLAFVSIREVEIKFMGKIDPGMTIDDITFTPATSSTNLIAGKHEDVGEVNVTQNGYDLTVEYIVDKEGCVITETHLAVEEDCALIPQTKKGNPIPGHFEFPMLHDPAVTSYTETIDVTGMAGEPLCIAAHAVVYCPVEDCYDTVWQIGDVEKTNEDKGWLENYADEFNWEYPAGPITLGPGLTASAPLFTTPFIIDITPTSEFPYNSNFNKGYATDIDVKWDGEMLFGGILTVSWSPGSSAAEKKVVSGDGSISATFSASGINASGQGWFLDKYPLVQQSTDVAPLAYGTHTINFQHTQGDGTFWDWIRLEKICDQGETAWGEGDLFPGHTWAMHFSFF